MKMKYLKYVLKHKWYVMIECFKKGLFWRGIVHDISKLYPDEFIPYSNFFYGEKPRNINRCHAPTETGDNDFERAWFLHQKRNKHHWNWWVLPDKDGIKILDIEEPYLTELLCDWMGAAKAQGKFSPKWDPMFETRKWWVNNSRYMSLSEKTKKELNKRIYEQRKG